MTASRLPLNALLAFEAAARRRSMSAAAQELGVTHGAVSRHVRGLEERFGVPLLRRLAKSVEPTAAGSQLAASLAEGFKLMQIGVARLTPGALTLACSATIMNHWLIPRLGRFKRAHPEVEIRLNVSHGEVDFVRDEISLAIRSSMVRAPADVGTRPLLREEIGAVCHPDYAAQAGLAVPADLAGARLLGTVTRPAAWDEWLAATAQRSLRLEAQESFEHFYLLIQAAACGLGVGIAPRFLVADEMRRGQLVAPFGFVEGPHVLNLWVASHLRARLDLKRLAEWIEAEMQDPTANRG
ncbi:LysR substrate-binding domain-containing protein [Dankookia sp. GCM10030260]|uniref:LysR substrate-binding domain-containing protein n=1 Tax=Dankookia sp. GCM10030260 TaxID=3273390 RepID=UPI003623E33E